MQHRWFLGRGFYSVLLAAVALALVAGISYWLVEASGEAGIEKTEVAPVPEAGLKMVMTQLVAYDVSSATSGAEVRAATARLLQGWRGFHLQQVRARFSEAADETAAPGLLSSASGPVHFQADEGWVDSGEGNLLLAGNIHGRRESDGMEIEAERLEYERAVDELRLFRVRLHSPKFEKTDSVVTTDSRLLHMRSGKSNTPRIVHPFFQRFGGGEVHDE